MIPSDRLGSRLSSALNLFGVLVVGYYLTRQYLFEGLPGWVYATALLALVAWLAFTVIRKAWRHAGLLALLLMVVCGALTAVPTNGLAIVPAVAALGQATRDVRIPMVRAVWLAAIAMVVALLGSVAGPTSLLGILSIEAGFLVAFLVGFSRRQHLATEAQALELRESAMAMREEQAVVASLAARQAVARDIHDLLAHSLGGLVVQLDAVEALLESGDVEGALGRVRDSRALAAEGLGESRRAVGALRDEAASDGPVLPDEFVDGLLALVTAHRSLGGAIEFAETGSRRSLPAPLAVAAHRAFQESLTNARKHAAAQLVAAGLDWSGDTVALTVENALDPGAASALHQGARAQGGGHGLVGMRERFLGVPGGSATAGVEGERFVVRVRGNVA